MNDVARQERDLNHLSALAEEAYPYAAPSLAIIAHSDPDELNNALLQADGENFRSRLAVENAQHGVKINQTLGNYDLVEQHRRELGQHLEEEAVSSRSARFARYVLDKRFELAKPIRRAGAAVTAVSCALVLGGSTYFIETGKSDSAVQPTPEPSVPAQKAQAKEKPEDYDISETNIAIFGGTGLIVGWLVGYGLSDKFLGPKGARRMARRRINQQDQERLERIKQIAKQNQ